MSERIDDPSFEDYSWVDDERRLHENGGQQAQPDLWNAYRHDAGDSSFAYNGKLYVHRACPANGKLNPCQLADILIYSQ